MLRPHAVIAAVVAPRQSSSEGEAIRWMDRGPRRFEPEVVAAASKSEDGNPRLISLSFTWPQRNSSWSKLKSASMPSDEQLEEEEDDGDDYASVVPL
jgi:hypothetical protein